MLTLSVPLYMYENFRQISQDRYNVDSLFVHNMKLDHLY